MSLILEALRRSEAERQRGQAPGLFVEQQPLRRPVRRRGGGAWPWAGAALLVAIAAGWGWREVSRAGAGDEAGDATTGAGVVPTAVPASAVPAAVQAAIPAVVPAAVPAPIPPEIPAAVPPPVPAAASAPAPEPALAGAPAAPAAPAAVAPPATRDPPHAEPVIAPPIESPPAPAPAAPAQPIADAGAPPRSLADLAPGERAALPPLQLSMHVYSDAPERRIVIIDGHRLGEGATAGPGLVVEAIRRDGVVLVHDGRRLLLPRP